MLRELVLFSGFKFQIRITPVYSDFHFSLVVFMSFCFLQKMLLTPKCLKDTTEEIVDG
jgi:hypothetical protein